MQPPRFAAQAFGTMSVILRFFMEDNSWRTNVSVHRADSLGLDTEAAAAFNEQIALHSPASASPKDNQFVFPRALGRARAGRGTGLQESIMKCPRENPFRTRPKEIRRTSGRTDCTKSPGMRSPRGPLPTAGKCPARTCRGFAHHVLYHSGPP